MIATAVVTAPTAGTVARGATVIPRMADDLPDSIGVNVHTNPVWPAMGSRWPQVIQLIGEMGIRQVRDHAERPEMMNQLTAATGAKICAIVQTQLDPMRRLTDINELDLRLADAKAMTGLTWLEGPNEYDGQGVDNWPTYLTTWMQQLHDKAKADPVLSGKTILAPTLAEGSSQMTNLNPLLDAGNVHSYYGLYNPTDAVADWHYGRGQIVTPGKPIYSTETGYHNANWSMDEQVSAKYTARLLLQQFNHGFAKTFIYEFCDEADDPNSINLENHLGLLRYDLSYKPAGTAVKNMISLLSDKGAAFTPAGLDYTIAGAPDDVHTTLVQKRDGRYYLALWREVMSFDVDESARTPINVPPVPVTVDFNSPLALKQFYLDSLTPVRSDAPASHVAVNVTDAVTFLELSAPAWTHEGSGSWSAAANWANGVPNAAGQLALFGYRAGGAAASVVVDADVRVGAISFSNAGGYGVGGTHTITLDAAAGVPAATIGAFDGNHTVSAPLVLADDLTANIAAGSLTISDFTAAGHSISKSGGGELRLNHVRATGLTVNGGIVKLLPSGGTSAGASKVASLAVAAGAKADVGDNVLIVANAASASAFSGGSYGGVAGLVASGRMGSSFIASLPAGLAALGVASADELGKVGQTFRGQVLSGGDILVLFTYGGDADLNGKLDGDDYFRLDSGFAGHAHGWFNGDFDYNGVVNGDDYFVLDANIGRQAIDLFDPTPGIDDIAAVPEPSSGLVVAAAAAALGARPRRRRPHVTAA